MSEQINNLSDNFDMEIYKQSISLQSTKIAKIKATTTGTKYQYVVFVAGAVSLPASYKAAALKASILTDSIIETQGLDSFLPEYDKIAKSLSFDYFADLAEKVPQKKVTKKDIIKDIICFQSLKQNWDGYGAYPLEVDSAANAIELLNLLNSEAYGQIDQVYPNPNGTVSMVWTNSFNEELAVEIGNKTMSYYVQLCSKQTLFKNEILINDEEAKRISDYVISMV